MQADYPKKINPTYWDRVHVQPRVRQFPDTGESSETTGRKWRPSPEVVQHLKRPVPEVTFYDRDYTVTNQLTRSQTCEDFSYKTPEARRFYKHKACTENKYTYPPSRRLTDQPPMVNAHGTTETRNAYKVPELPPSLVTDKNQHKHPAYLPDSPMIEPSWHKDLEPLDTTHEGYEKYLDPYLTTSRLHHRPYTTEQLSRRSVTKDIVTYHSLSKDPWMMADSTTEDNGIVINEDPNDREDASREPENVLVFDWPINVVVSEPKILSPDPDVAQQGKDVQKLGPVWKTVRYADTKRQFESTAPFCALHVNHQLESLTPKCKAFDMLQRFDQTLAALTHGLLKQKKILQNTLDTLPAEVRNTVQNALQSADSQYKKISDDLLQYVCGRRSQVIQHRREMFLSRNMGVREALHAIPPTELVLFEHNRLTQLIEALPDKIDHFVANTDKCRCCQFHKRRRQSSDARNSEDNSQESEREKSPERKRCHKQRRRRNSSESEYAEDEPQSRDRKRHQKKQRRRLESQGSEDNSRSRIKRRR